MAPLVSIVLVSYNRPHYLASAIDSALGQSWPNLELIVVDNPSSSSPEIAQMVARYPAARLIVNPDNRGFTGGMNAGIAAARGEFVYMTEDDIELEPDCVALLVDYFQSHRETGLAGPIMVNRGSRSIRCAGGQFQLGAIYRMTVLGADQPEHTYAGSAPYSVTYLPGSMMMARRDRLHDLGGFRDDFFMYVEDVELCARVLKHRLSIVVVPAARVVHREPSSDVSPTLEFHKIKNLAALYFIHAPLHVVPAFVLRYGVWAALRMVGGRSDRIGIHVKAWSWAIAHAPQLLADRFRTISKRALAPHPGLSG